LLGGGPVSNAVTLWRQLDRIAPRVGVGGITVLVILVALVVRFDFFVRIVDHSFLSGSTPSLIALRSMGFKLVRFLGPVTKDGKTTQIGMGAQVERRRDVQCCSCFH